VLHLVRVEALTRVHDGGGVAGEDITVHRVPLAGVRDWLDERRRAGLQVEPRIYAALYLLD
jgi:ADP-ribose pyrophosphatase